MPLFQPDAVQVPSCHFIGGRIVFAATGEAITRHPRLAKMTFTASTYTGAAIMANCALHGPKHVTLELGGKSPQLVVEDASAAQERDRLWGDMGCMAHGLCALSMACCDVDRKPQFAHVRTPISPSQHCAAVLQ